MARTNLRPLVLGRPETALMSGIQDQSSLNPLVMRTRKRRLVTHSLKSSETIIQLNRPICGPWSDAHRQFGRTVQRRRSALACGRTAFV